MKKISLIIFVLIFAFSLVACRRTTTTTMSTTTGSTTKESIDEFNEDMLEYKLSANLDFYTVSSVYETNIEELVIPKYHNDIPVRQIERFERFYNLKKITIPDTIYGIDSSLYSFCSKLEYNEYENGLYIGTEDNPYFYLYRPNSVKLETIEVHEDTKIIGDQCFLNNTKLKTVRLPEGIKRIGYSAFMSALNLVNINLPDSIEYMDVQAFSYCKALTKVVIPKHIKTISESLFVNCNSLSSVELNDEVETIMLNAFQGCTALSSIKIPESVKNVYPKSFLGCSKLLTLYIDSSNALKADSNSTLYEYVRDLYIKDNLELNEYLSSQFNFVESPTIDGYKHYVINK